MNILCFQTTTLMDKYFRHWIPGVWSLSQGKIYYTSVSYNLNKKEKRSWYVSLWKCDMSLKVSSTLSKNWNRYCSHTCNAIRCHNMLTSFFPKYSCNLNNLLITVHWTEAVWGNYSPKIYRRVKTFGLLTPIPVLMGLGGWQDTLKITYSSLTLKGAGFLVS